MMVSIKREREKARTVPSARKMGAKTGEISKYLDKQAMYCFSISLLLRFIKIPHPFFK
jgi:hypothetical protein